MGRRGIKDEIWTRVRYGEAFWRARSKAKPQAPERKLLYHRRGLSRTLKYSLGHPHNHILSHVA